MMPTATPKPPPSRPLPRKPVQRLASLKNPLPAHRFSKSGPSALPPTRTSTCPNPNCVDSNIVDDDGQRVCASCGTVITDSNIVSEVTFGETASGAAQVQGAFVAADRTHARSTGPGFHRGDGSSNRERTEQMGRHEISRLANALGIQQSIAEVATRIFKLAVGFNFIQGRRLNSVAAVCLYVACRRQDDGNTVMLIDLSDVIKVNVFSLGRVYTAILEELRMNYGPYPIPPINPENLIYRFAQQLEFGPKRIHVAKEAVRIVQRMNRDWMTHGRRPSGICGAALILAARMNNFRRTVREVVYIVKVTELTLNKRLEEFKATPSGNLTVEQFRTVTLETEHDPPAFYLAKQGKQPSKRGKKRKAADAIEEGERTSHPAHQTPAPDTRGPPQYDKDGFAIPYPIDPALRRAAHHDDPIDPSLTSAVNSALTELERQNPASEAGLDATNSSSASNNAASDTDRIFAARLTHNEENTSAARDPPVQPKRGRGRPPGRKNNPIPIPTEADLAVEAALESEISSALTSTEMTAAAAGSQRTKPNDAQASQAQPPSSSKPVVIPQPSSPSNSSDNTPSNQDSTLVDLDSDSEVANCLLTPVERDIKEAIWVHENRDWLLTQQQKMLKAARAEQMGIPGTATNPTKRRKRRRGRIGDVSYLDNDTHEGGEGTENVTSRPTTPAGAVRAMLGKRGYSSKINYEIVKDLYGEDEAGSEASTESRRSRSRVRSRVGRSPSVSSDWSASTSRTSTPAPTLSPPTQQSPGQVSATATGKPSAVPGAEKPTPPTAAPSQVPVLPAEEGVEVLGPAPSHSPTSSVASPRPLVPLAQADNNNYNEDDEEIGDPEDYVDDDEDEDMNDGIEAAFEGRYEGDSDDGEDEEQ